jgi:hypothetical protein
VFAAEHLLRLAGIDLGRELVERGAEIVGDRLARFSPLDEHGKIVDAPLQRIAEIAILLEPSPALEKLLCRRLILPEVRIRDARFDFGELVGRLCRVKDSSAGRWRGAPGLRACEAVRPVGGP